MSTPSPRSRESRTGTRSVLKTAPCLRGNFYDIFGVLYIADIFPVRHKFCGFGSPSGIRQQRTWCMAIQRWRQVSQASSQTILLKRSLPLIDRQHLFLFPVDQFISYSSVRINLLTKNRRVFCIHHFQNTVCIYSEVIYQQTQLWVWWNGAKRQRWWAVPTQTNPTISTWINMDNTVAVALEHS
jgi:hypothetical protein